MSQTNSKTIRCSGFTQRLAFPGTSCILSLSLSPCLANENLILPSTGIHFWRWMKFQCQAQVAPLISYRNKWWRGEDVSLVHRQWRDGSRSLGDACLIVALRSLPCPCGLIWGGWTGGSCFTVVRRLFIYVGHFSADSHGPVFTRPLRIDFNFKEKLLNRGFRVYLWFKFNQSKKALKKFSVISLIKKNICMYIYIFK